MRWTVSGGSFGGVKPHHKNNQRTTATWTRPGRNATFLKGLLIAAFFVAPFLFCPQKREDGAPTTALPSPYAPPHAPTFLTSLFVAFLIGFYSLVANVMNTSQSFSFSSSAILFGLSLWGFWLCIGIIPGVGEICATKGLYGRDINKPDTHYMFILPLLPPLLSLSYFQS